MGELTRTPAPSHDSPAGLPPRSKAPDGGRTHRPAHEPAAWTHLLSQPAEAGERQADARASDVLRGAAGRGRSARLPSPTRDHVPDGTPAEVAGHAGRGRPLAGPDLAWAEARFGTGFGHVRVHDDDGAAALAETAGARAFTAGSHVFFNRGEYRTGAPARRGLLAHELAHVEQGPAGAARLWRKPKGEVILGEPEISSGGSQSPEGVVRLEAYAMGMDHAAEVLAQAGLTFANAPGRNNVFVGLHQKFVKVYNSQGRPLGRVELKEVVGLKFNTGVYVQGPDGLVALTISDSGAIGTEQKLSLLGQRDLTEAERKEMQEDALEAEEEGRPPKPAPSTMIDFEKILNEPDKVKSLIASVPDALVIYFVPTLDQKPTGKGKGSGEKQSLYASPIEGRGDGEPANAPPWPVAVEGPRLAPIGSNPTYVAKVDWSANGNWTVTSQALTQVGETIHYKWELFDISTHAKKELAANPANAEGVTATKSLDQRVEEFKTAKAGAGKDVTGMGGANREFRREFEDWWKDTERARRSSVSPSGSTVGERLSNAAANRLALELAPVSLLVTALGAALRWLADLFAGPRQQQEIPLDTEGVFLVRVITTPGINEDRKGNKVVRPPSVNAKVVEVTPMDQAVQESLDEPANQLDELRAQITRAEEAGNKAKADYLRTLLAAATERFEGSPLTLLIKKRDEKQKELDEFRKNYPTLSDYSRAREVDQIKEQIARYHHHERERTAGGGLGLGSLRRLNATLISEVTAEQYPLLLSAGPMADEDGKKRWMISDVTNQDGDAHIGTGDTSSKAFRDALDRFGGKAAYGRGRIGVRTAGLGLERDAPAEMLVDSAPTDWALAEKRIDDLVTTLTALGLFVASAGTAAVVIGTAVAAKRLLERWNAGRLRLDPATVSDSLGLLAGLGAAGKLGAGLRVQRFEKYFAVVQEGRVTEAQIAAAAKALQGAQKLATVVEIANKALDYGGLVWGNVEFLEQMMSINEQERTGAITHAAARRARAGSLNSAVQNWGYFLAGNVPKAKGRVHQDPAGKPGQRPPAAPPQERTPADTRPQERTPADTRPQERTPADTEKAPVEQVPEREGKARQERGQPVPLGERRATLDEMKAALPEDLRDMVTIDRTLEGDDVRADYEVDKDTGLITEIRLRCSPDARPATVRLHEQTVRTMQKYQGFAGRVRLAITWLIEVVGITPDTPNPEHRESFEAALEVHKLPKLIREQVQRMKAMEPNAQAQAEAELEGLKTQLDDALLKLDIGGEGEARGFVAAKGMSKEKQKQWVALRAELRTYKKGSDPHRDTRRKMYLLEGGDLPFPHWEAVYRSNLNRATKSNKIEQAERDRVGWGQRTSVMVGGEERVLDIGDENRQRAIEVKAYESGNVSATKENRAEVEKDAKLRKRGWQITWLFIDTYPSAPLQELLLASGITVEIRIRKNLPAEVVTIIPPPKKKKAGVK